MALRVYPGAKNPTHQISLSDGVRTYGLQLLDGPRSIQEIPMTPSTVHFSGGGTKFGDWEPGMSHIEQRTWEGGRAQADFVDDPTRYFDAKNAWTLTPGRLFPAPAWKFSNGYLGEIIERLPGDIDWRVLRGETGGTRGIYEKFTHSSAWANADSLYLWVRRVGNPTELYVRFYPDSGSQPDTGNPYMGLSPATIDEDDTPEENVVYLLKIDVTAIGTMSGTTSWMGISCQSGDDASNHWEVGVDVDGGGSYVYDDVSSYVSADFSVYYRLSSVVEDRKWNFFEFEGALYAVDNQVDEGASNLYINGERGKATSGAAVLITNTNASMTADEYIGAWIKIVGGTGKGQKRQITDNTDTTITTATWDVTPDSTSEYVIYHTDIWHDITPSSGDQIDGVVGSICIVDDYVCFAQGQSVNILKMRWNPSASPPAHEFDDDGTNKADILFTMFDGTNGVQVYAANTSAATVARATPTAWLTDQVFGSSFDIGNNEQPITNLYLHDGYLYAFKPDGRYVINPDDSVSKAIGEIGFIKSENNGEAVLFYGLYSYFSWGGYSIQRLYSSSGNYDLSNIGPDKDEGLPDDRKGRCVALLGTPPGVIAAIESDEYSSVLVLPVNGYGWHEIFRSPMSGDKVQNIYFQDSYNPRLWISVGGEMVYMDWPRHSFNPLKDSNITYMPEAHLISSTIDMGVSNLPKFIESLTATVENLASGIEVQLDYQTNENVGTDTWISAGAFQINPFDDLEINQGEIYKMRFRLRLYTNVESTPPIVNATVLEGYARTPVKYQWNMRIKISSTQRDMSGVGRDTDPDELMTWLKNCARSSTKIYMRSVFEDMDNKYVIVEPPTLLREYRNKILSFWGGQVQITVREK